MTIKLSKPFSRNNAVDEFDVRQMKKALNRLGYYTPKEGTGITGIPDATVFTALKAFQKDQGLEPTGSARPDDATIKTLNTESKNVTGKYIWRTVQDERVRPDHAARNGAEFDLSDSPDPGDDFNCRCWIEYVSSNEITKEELPKLEIDPPIIPGTNILDRSIPESWDANIPRIYNPNESRAVPLLPFPAPNPAIDPTMELPYDDPVNPFPSRKYWDF